MRNHIRPLDPIVIDQIAAGEVVERPASVVKELVENSIDAGASHIEVLLQEGGIRRIEVRDDGLGISADELILAVSSHATSKLRTPEDLEAVASLGFRGEALASIASVSRLEITSLTQDQEDAASILVDFGKAVGPRAAAGGRGTRIVVADLFAQLPARLKFMKRPATELRHCLSWVERLALAHVGVGFTLKHDGRILLEVAASDDLDARCGAVYGIGVAKNMVQIQRQSGPIVLHGRVGPPESARRNASRVDIFLNGRWVRDPRLLRAVREGVKEFVPLGHYPTLYLALSVPPHRIDVNVHPQKTEVRFRDERLVIGSVVKTLQRGLATAPWATRGVGVVGKYDAPNSSSLSSNLTRPAWPGQVRESHYPPAAARSQPGAESALPLQRTPGDTVGQVLSVANTFLVREVTGGMEILDQHALHERVNLEELRRDLRAGVVMSQPLLVPSLVDVGKAELDLLLTRAEVFAKLGVDLEAFGEHTVAIRAIPARLTRLVPEKLVMDLLEIAQEHKSASVDQLMEESLHSMACRGAVMAGDHLDQDGLRGLLARGADLPQDRTCAHGRPVRVFLSLEDLEKAFYRRV